MARADSIVQRLRPWLLQWLREATETWVAIGEWLKAVDGAMTSAQSIGKKVRPLVLALALAAVGYGYGSPLLRAVICIIRSAGCEQVVDDLEHRALGAGRKLLDALDTAKKTDVDVDRLGGGVCTNAKQLVERDGENLCKLGK